MEMTVHVTIPMDAAELDRAKSAAIALGISLEDYLHRVVTGHLPPMNVSSEKGDISLLFGFFESDEPTDIARDKDALLSEAVWQEHLRKTRQSP